MKVAIVGTGYVGLVTAASLSSDGHEVVCVDVQPERVAALSRGETPIHENGLAPLVRKGVTQGRLRATTSIAEAVAASELTMICVGTPTEDGRINLDAVRAAAGAIGAALKAHPSWHVVVVKSTVVPGTAGGLVRETLEAASGMKAGRGFGLANNPEFLSQGSAVRDFSQPDRVVIGEWDTRSGDRVAELYAGFRCPVVRTGLVNAELVKYAANSLQASLISFANQVAAICERTPGADEAVVMEAVRLDRNLTFPVARAGVVTAPAEAFLRAGIGFGGSCFPKDLAALRHFAQSVGAATPLLDGVIAINRDRPDTVLDLVDQIVGGVAGKTMAVLGVAFKPGTDDIRESPGIRLAELLLDRGAAVRCHDPLPPALEHARHRLGSRVLLSDSAAAVLEGVDGAVLATAWPEYREWDWGRLAGMMARPVLLDGRNALRSVSLPAALQYHRIGVGPMGH